MAFQALLSSLRAGQKPDFPGNASSLDYARSLDGEDPLAHLRDEYIVPTKAMIRKRKLGGEFGAARWGSQWRDPGPCPSDESTEDGSSAQSGADRQPAVYFCGNSLGLQPRATRHYVDAQLETWRSIAVQGHFVAMADSPLAPWQDMAAVCAAHMAPLVGAASDSEVVAMNTLTANLHLLMASFYRPTATRHKILAEWKPFPSDTYAIASQLQWHGLDAASSLVELFPDAGDRDAQDMRISTEAVLAAIDAHADDAALLLLPGIQYYSGQLFDMPRITAHAHRRGLVVGWDLAHAIGNVELRLHDWDVDFAVWCTYKYLNSGPGGIAGAFVHERHGRVTPNDAADPSKGWQFRPRLSGWYGGDIGVRFNMDKAFQPTPGAQGFQLSNPSAMDLACLRASLSVFDKTSIQALRDKSLVLTAYAEALLDGILSDSKSRRGNNGSEAPAPFRVITPSNPAERGAQLSVLLAPGTMPTVAAALEAAGVILDQRKPDVIRIAPVPMYNTFGEVCTVVNVLRDVMLGGPLGGLM